MASASSSSARNLFSDSKSRINQRVQFTVQGLGSLGKYLVKSSKSSEILMQSAKNFSQQEGHLESADLVSKYFCFFRFLIPLIIRLFDF